MTAVARKVQTAFRIERELHEGLRAVWERDGIGISEQVRRAIRAWLESKGAIRRAAPRRVGPRRKA
jgi:hypothetical protein